MLKEIVNGTVTALDALDGLDQVEFYEGQLEDLENFLIDPPHAFVALELANNDRERFVDINCGIAIYLCTSHMEGQNKNGMYDLIDEVITALHNVYMVEDKLFFKSFNEVGIFPGLCVYKLNFALGAIN